MLRDSPPVVQRGIMEAQAQPVYLGPITLYWRHRAAASRHLRQAGTLQPHRAILIPSVIVEGQTILSYFLTKGIIRRSKANKSPHLGQITERGKAREQY